MVRVAQTTGLSCWLYRSMQLCIYHSPITYPLACVDIGFLRYGGARDGSPKLARTTHPLEQ